VRGHESKRVHKGLKWLHIVILLGLLAKIKCSICSYPFDHGYPVIDWT
jgi:hypothetical protein